ncbi:hypothetical protein HY090_01145 [Candidatus Kaiserbacteria bacterium]|nr:hypothetical protein [Candidatus Kaiserbacteria bacterium]
MERLFERESRRMINVGWAHGRYLDFWSIIHFLTGVILGAGALLLNVPLLPLLIGIFLIASVYEMGEVLAGIAEDLENVIIDILIAVLGAFLTIHYLNGISKVLIAYLLIGALIGNLFLMRTGWHAYLKRKIKNKK